MLPLDAFVSKFGALEPRDAIGWSLRLARKVADLHQRGLVHGRISTAALRGEAPVARAAGALVEAPFAPIERPFQAPERRRGGRPSAADDVWAIACVAFHLRTGTPPFGDDHASLKAVAGRPQAPTLASHRIDDAALQRLLDVTFVTDPQSRPSVRAVALGLEALLPADLALALPELDDDEGSGGMESQRASVFAGGHGAVLLVDDEGPPTRVGTRQDAVTTPHAYRHGLRW